MNDIAKEEIEAIKAIFGQDYSNRTNQIDIPWKDPIKEIIHMIRIQAFENQEVLVDFEFVYTPNYPFECPILQVSNPQGLGGNLVKLQSELKQHSFQYLGQEMIFELASLVKEFIEDHNEFNDLKTSGFISMKNNLKAEAVKLNKQDEKEAKEKKLLKQQENEELQEAIQKELDMKKLLLLSQHKQSTNDIYLNDSLDEEDSNDFQYTDNNALTSNICNSDTPLIKNAIVSPCRIGQNPYHTLCWFNYSSELFMIETFEIQSPTTSLESKMQNFLTLNHPNTPKIYDYTILTTENSTILKILVSAVKIGVLDILKVSGTIPLKSAANILFGMISLMQYYQSENIEISTLTLNDIYYDNQMNVQFMGSFLFPEFHLKPEKSPFNGFTLPNLEDECLKQEKQLFDVGSLLLILLNGEEIYKFKDPISCAENTQYSNSNLLSIVKMLMDTNISINTTLESLLEHPFLTMEQEASMRVRKDYSGEYDHPREINVSRYVNDFDEVEFLGQGGFGAVVKAKNVIDGRFYAIKKIKLNPKDTKRLLREVQTISRVHSEYVVRYYQAWFEDSDGLNIPSEDSESDYSDYTSDESSDWLSSGVSLDLHKSSSVKILRRISTGVSKSPIRGSFTKILYIQMEYCKNNTLRDVIDLGISHEDAWKHFRQLLEGLGHLHSQGIIHRDLKPSNVFLDESGTVKIGDFGLATVKGNLIHQEPIDLIKSTADMTSEVGTPVYTAPEILISTGRYNSKVDMYSLGILFFELIYKMNTGMQRSVVLRDLRKSTIDFPGDFDFEELSNQHQIIKNLLNHVPKERFSCMELLQSSLVPASVEGEYISEELLRVVRQRNPVYFSRLINALYAQSVDKHKDFAYDFNSTPGFDQTIGRVTALVHSHALKIFLNHGAIRIVSPPIIPKTDQISRIYGAKKPVEFIDVNGDVVQLLYDLTVPFARSLSQNTEENIVFPLKRYSLERVYRQNITGGQPVAVEECDYDVVFEDLGNSMVPESEVIKVVFEILSFNGVLNVGDYTIRINHMKNLNIIFGNIGIPLLLRKPVLDILQQLHHPLKVGQVKQCLVKLGIDIYMIDKLLTYDKSTAISDSLNLSRDTEINQTLTTLTKNIRALGIKNKITFDPLLVYNPNVFESFVFQIVKKTTKYDIFAAGGRYDTLLYKFISPFAKNKPMHAVGVNIALSKFVSMVCGQYLDDERRTITKADVLVTFMGNKEIMVPHQLSIISELWSSGISADLSFLDLNTYNNLDTQRQDYKHAVILKAKGLDSFIIKVKDLQTKQETEIQRSMLIKYFEKEEHIGSQPKNLLELPAPTIIPMLQKKSNQKHQLHAQILSEKSIHAIYDIIGRTAIVCVELTVMDIESLVMFWKSSEVKVPKGYSTVVRDYLMVVKRQVMKIEGRFFWFYSNIDSRVVPHWRINGNSAVLE